MGFYPHSLVFYAYLMGLIRRQKSDQICALKIISVRMNNAKEIFVLRLIVEIPKFLKKIVI